MNIRQVLRMEWNISRNLGEGVITKLLRAFWVAIYLLKAARTGFCGMRGEQLGERVIVDGWRKAFINNWAGSSCPCLAGDGYYEEHVDRSRFVPVGGPRKYLHRFRVMWDWYTMSWLGIDVNKRLYPAAFRSIDA